MLKILPEKRKRPRSPLLSEASVSSGNVHFPCVALDVSTGGISVASKTLLHVHRSDVLVSFVLPDKGIWFHCWMELVREEKVDDVIIWGLKFRSQDTWMTDHIDAYVRENLGETYPRLERSTG
jgi:hypothetical protein